jgi:hypothetical protein
MKTLTQSLFLPLFLAVGALAIAACSTEAPVQTSAEADAVTVVCTPGDETCDIGCFYDGGPSTDDCIIRCNASGTGWDTLASCGWAQNFPYSASCLDTNPHPICQNN